MDTRFFVQTQDFQEYANVVPVLEYFVDRACLPGWKIARHRLPYDDLTWVLSGKATYWCDGKPHVALAGDLLYLPQGSVREAVTDPDDPMHCLACNFQCASQGGKPVRLPFDTLSSLGFPEGLRELYHRLNQVWLEAKPGHELEVRGWVTLILHRWLVAARSEPGPEVASPRLALVQRHIIQYCSESLPVSRLAALVRLHPGYFGTWFRRQTGLTVHQYINRIRVRKAADLLSTGGFNVTEAGDKCGFSDVFHFSKVFRQVTGRPPSEWTRETSLDP